MKALNLSTSKLVHTYIAAQAAIPAHCYDNSTPIINNFWTAFTTPNVYGYYYSGATTDGPYLMDNKTKECKLAQYFNKRDFALRSWEFNNWTKLDLNYHYNEGDSDIDRYNPQAGDQFYYQKIFSDEVIDLEFPDNRYEIFARCAQSRSQALGREPGVNGFGTSRDLSEIGYDGRHYSHSREFRSNIIAEKLFWETVWKDFNLDQ